MRRYILFACLLTGFVFSACQEERFISLPEAAQTTTASRQKIRRRQPARRGGDLSLAAVSAFRKKTTQIKKPPSPPSPYYREYIFLIEPNGKRKIDGLLILDVSGSMDTHLEKTGKRLLPLLSSITDYDWQLALTLADNGDHGEAIKKHTQAQWQDNVNNRKPHFGRLMKLEAPPVLLKTDSYNCQILEERILTPQTPNYNEVFKASLSRFPKTCIYRTYQWKAEQLLYLDEGITSSKTYPPFFQNSVEQPLRALKSAMERVTFDNRDLFREGVDFFSLIITNGEERLEDRERATTAQDVKDTFDTYLKPLGKRFFHFSILVKDRECQLKQNHEAVGYSIMELANITTGPEGNISICEEDFGPALQGISKAVETLVERSVDIPEPFIPETLKVEFLSGSPLPYRLSGNRVIFERAPPESMEVKISFFIPPP